ncbi:MAG TPA: hypothetical protein VGN26_19055 [Armatimonadota bacterium]|jgi:hypothetical protein
MVKPEGDGLLGKGDEPTHKWLLAPGAGSAGGEVPGEGDAKRFLRFGMPQTTASPM